MFGAEVSGVAEVVQASGWFLENAWIVPIIPAVAFFLIIFFGKKLPMKGSELGILSMLATLFFSAMAVWQWIDAVNSAPEGSAMAPVIKSWTWWTTGGFDFTIGQHMDGLSLTVLIVVAFMSSIFYKILRIKRQHPTGPSSRQKPICADPL